MDRHYLVCVRTRWGLEYWPVLVREGESLTQLVRRQSWETDKIISEEIVKCDEIGEKEFVDLVTHW